MESNTPLLLLFPKVVLYDMPVKKIFKNLQQLNKCKKPPQKPDMHDVPYYKPEGILLKYYV